MARILDLLRTQKWQNFFFCMIKLNSILKTRPYRSRTSFPRMFILKLEQDMKPDQLNKRDLKNSFLIYALIGTIFINCLLMFSQTGLLIGRGSKRQISRDFQGQIRGKIDRFRGIYLNLAAPRPREISEAPHRHQIQRIPVQNFQQVLDNKLFSL